MKRAVWWFLRVCRTFGDSEAVLDIFLEIQIFEQIFEGLG